MKRLFSLLCACALLLAATACRNTDAPADDAQQPAAPQTETVSLYLPDGEAMYVIPTDMELTQADDMAEPLVNALISQGALPTEAAVNHCTVQDDSITLDMNDGYAAALAHNGTAGETMLLAALVNTFLDYYDAQSLTLTAEGAVIETGHAIYDQPFTALLATEADAPA